MRGDVSKINIDVVEIDVDVDEEGKENVDLTSCLALLKQHNKPHTTVRASKKVVRDLQHCAVLATQETIDQTEALSAMIKLCNSVNRTRLEAGLLNAAIQSITEHSKNASEGPS